MRDTVVEEACNKEADWDEVASKTRKKCVSNAASDLWFATRALGRVVRGSCEQRRLACEERQQRSKGCCRGAQAAGDGRAASLARLECIAGSRGAPQAKRSTSTSGASETRPRWPYHHVSPPRGGPIIQIIPIPGSVYCVLIRIVFIVLYCCIMYCATLVSSKVGNCS